MIRYADALTDINTAIEREASGWGIRARERTTIYRDAGKYIKTRPHPVTGNPQQLGDFWSEVKYVYILRQRKKCVFCERRIGDGRVEWDVEHFRPKGRVQDWIPHEDITPVGEYGFAMGTPADEGYYRLAYHPENYAVSCKTCNELFKKDYFPVAGVRNFDGDSPDTYDDEKAFLPYPLGMRGDDPEALIGFVGANAVPRVLAERDLIRHRRGGLTIDLLGLNRQDLILQRAQWLLYAVWANVKNADGGDADASALLTDFAEDKFPFANCTRCFLDLCRNARPLAEAMIPEFKRIIASEV